MFRSVASWRDDIVAALSALGGIGEYQEIYAEVAARRSELSPAWQATVRRVIETASSDSANYQSGAPDLFHSVHGLGRGVWGLRLMPEEHPSVAETALPEASAEQGFAADSVVRVAIEQCAVRRAIEHYERLGAERIEELGKPYDLRVHLGGVELHVEVKGSTRPLDAVTLTKNEVEDARRTRTNELFVVDRIRLSTDSQGRVTAAGGQASVWSKWDPRPETLTAMIYSHRLDKSVARRVR